MIAGGTESSVCPLGIGGFASMQALSVRNDDPTAASRRSIGTATDSSSARVPACWCSRSTSTPAVAARGSTQNWPASA